MNLATKIFKHFKLVCKHKYLVFVYCSKAGIPWRGLMHDWSKFSPTEFFESVKYYTGTGSPIDACKKDIGYSNAWLHHKGRNKHHYEYWVDYLDKGGIPMLIPYEYALEMCCDMLAAGKVYMGKSWTTEYPMEYWTKQREIRKIHPAIRDFQDKFFNNLKESGFEGITKEKTLKYYKDSVEDYKNSTL